MEEYKKRLLIEFNELKERIEKLDAMIKAYYSNELDFEPTCPIWLLHDQLQAMKSYMNILTLRYQIEGLEKYEGLSHEAR